MKTSIATVPDSVREAAERLNGYDHFSASSKTHCGRFNGFDTDITTVVKFLLSAGQGGDDSALAVTFDELAAMRGAVTRVAKNTIEDTVELDSMLIFDRHGTLTICNGKVRKPTRGQLRAIMAALGIAAPTEPAKNLKGG